jgi:DNA-binding XRE family transcriptional regulator
VPSSPFGHGRSETRDRPALVAAARRERRRLGKRLRAIRAERGLTQAKAAEAIGVHPVHVSRIETGDANVTIDTLVALAVAYRVELRDLFA